MKSLLLITILTLSSHCYNVCSIIKFSDYSFDLSALGSETIQLQGVSGLVKFANCVPDTCKNSNYNSITTTANTQASYLLQINNAVCYPMTSTSSLTQSMPLSCQILFTLTAKPLKKEFKSTTYPISQLKASLKTTTHTHSKLPIRPC